MKNIFTELSNHKEPNLERRIKSSQDEVCAWGAEVDRYEKYRLEWQKASKECYLPEIPLHVDIELSSSCNLQCKMCQHGNKADIESGFMEKGLVLKLIEECAQIGVYSIKFNWRGEVSLNPFLVEAVRHAKEAGILEVQINTNGLPKNDAIFIECAKSGIDRIIFSIDGFSKETYEKIRVGGNYDELLRNIYNLLEWKKKDNSYKPLIRVQMVRTESNKHEVNEFIDHWSKVVDDVRISDVMDRGQGDKMSVGDQVSIGRSRCPQPFQRLAVAYNGLVSSCCSDWNQEYVVGDVNKDSLLDVWNNEKMTYIRHVQTKKQHETVFICRHCSVKESYVWEKVK